MNDEHKKNNHSHNGCAGLYEEAEYHFNKGDYPAALKTLLEARKVKNEQPEKYFLALSTLYLNCKDKLSAIEACREGLKIHTESMDLRYFLAMCFCALSKYDSADITAREAIRLNPKDVRFYNVMGYICIINFEPEKAVNIYKKLMETDPKEENNALFNIGFAHFCSGNSREAKKAWKELLKKYPQDERTLYTMEVVRGER